jgi:predicted metal-dependent enzyme (double-stranded beta helix superfamily)
MYSRHFSRQNTFPFLDDVIALADIACAAREPERTVATLVDGLHALLEGDPQLPSFLFAAKPDAYARRELYRSGSHGYQVLAITWAPGQGSGVHDRADQWGVEAVVRGELEVIDFEATAQQALTRLRPTAHRTLEAGQVIGLLPPHDLHACRNAGTRESAVSFHVYGRPLENVRRFVQVKDGLYRAERASLSSI